MIDIKDDILIKKWRVAILASCIYCTSYKLRVAFIARVASYFYSTSYELLLAYELRDTVYCTSYELPFICELRITVYCTSYELLFNCELRWKKDDKNAMIMMLSKELLFEIIFWRRTLASLSPVSILLTFKRTPNLFCTTMISIKNFMCRINLSLH